MADFDLVADFGSYREVSDGLGAANTELSSIAGDTASVQGAAADAMRGSPLTAQASQALDNVHGILDKALTIATNATSADAEFDQRRAGDQSC